MSKRIPDKQAKAVADRFVELRRELGLSQDRAAERMDIGLGQIRSCLKRAYPKQHYCPKRKITCPCVISNTRRAIGCGYTETFIPFGILKICPNLL